MAAKKKTGAKTNKPKLKKETYKVSDKKKLTSTIDKYFENNDIDKLTGSLIVNAPKSKDLILLLEDLWISIKAANDNPKTINISVLFLFSAVTEFWTLQHDKNTRRMHKQQWLDGMVENRKSDIADTEMLIESKEKRLKEIIGEGTIDDLSSELKDKYWEIEEQIIQEKINIKKYKTDVQVFEGSKAYYNYDLTVNLKIMHDPTTQLLPKHELIMKMLKDFNVSPSKIILRDNAVKKDKTLNQQLAGLSD